MKTNKKVQTNSVQKSEEENAVKVTALAIIPKPITLLTPQDVPTATEVTEAPETATVPTVTEEAPQQAGRLHRRAKRLAVGSLSDEQPLERPCLLYTSYKVLRLAAPTAY